MNVLTREVFFHDTLPCHQPPVQYTGEKFWLEYLCHQSGVELFLPSEQDEQEEEDIIDEGIGMSACIFPLPRIAEMNSLKMCPLSFLFVKRVMKMRRYVYTSIIYVHVADVRFSDSDDEEELASASSETVGSSGIPGWGKVSKALIALSDLRVINNQARDIVKLFNNLEEYDKKPLIIYHAREGQLRGTFARSKWVGHISVEKMKRFSLCIMT